MNLKIKITLVVVILTFLLISTSGASKTIPYKPIENNLSSIQKPYPNQPEDVEYYALIIGVERFIDPDYNNLTYEEDKIDDGTIAMYDLLLNGSNWKEENIKLMLNEEATKDEIKKAIEEWLGSRADENDVVLIYYDGHGGKIKLKNRSKGHATICTYNQTMGGGLEVRITDKEFDSYVDKIKSKHITIILESCYSGKMLALRQSGRVILTAGGRFFFCGVDEDDNLNSGIFGYFLRMGFKGVADLNNDGWVTAEEVFRYARRPTIHHSFWFQFPFIIEFNNRSIIWFFQIPWMYDRHFGSIPLYEYKKD
jgi:hypothetical protein